MSDSLGCLGMVFLMAGCGGCVTYTASVERNELAEQRKVAIVQEYCETVNNFRLDIIETQETYTQKLTYFQLGHENFVMKGHHNFKNGTTVCKGWRPATENQRKRLAFKRKNASWADFGELRY